MTPLYRPRSLLLLLLWLVVSKPAWSHSPSTGLECEQVNRRQKWARWPQHIFFNHYKKRTLDIKFTEKNPLKHKQSVQSAMLLLFFCCFFTKAEQPAEQKEPATWKSNMEIKEKMGAGRPLSISPYLTFLYYCYLIRCSYTKGFCVQKKKKKKWAALLWLAHWEAPVKVWTRNHLLVRK